MDTDSNSLKLLCINVDHTFVAYLMAAAEPIILSLDICRNSEEARQKIASTTYNAYLLDLGVNEIATLSLINDIKQKSGKKGPIIVISDPYRDDKHLEVLKENNTIDYVLQKPLFPQQVDKLLDDLSQHQSATTTPAVSSGGRLQELRRAYDKTIYDKIALLAKLIKAVQNNPKQTELDELKNAVHKMGGSAGSYGYDKVSLLCKELDKQISEKLTSIHTIDVKWLNSLDDFLTKIKAAFQKNTETGNQSYIISSFVPRPSIFVVDYDLRLLELLERVKEQFPIDLYIESDPKKALERLKSQEFSPRAIVVSQNFPNSPYTGNDVLQAHKGSSQAMVSAMILDSDDLDTRFDVMSRGVNYVFHRPVSAYMLLRSMKDALDIRALHNFRVLVLDDDIDFCNFVTIMLSEVGLNVKSIQDSDDLIPTLREFNPHILLLDFLLAKFDGLQLLRTLRQDVAYNKLIIIIVTSSDESATRLSAYAAKADDIIYKPLDKALLQNRVLGLLERYVTLGQHAEAQTNTGFVKEKSLLTQLHDYLIKPGRHNQFLAIFEINRFADWAEKHGYADTNAVMVSISNQLQWETNKETTTFAYSTSKFAMIFNGLASKVVETKMYNLLMRIVESLPHLNLEFNCSVIPVSPSFGTAQDLLQAAEQGLYEARQKESAPVKVITIMPKDSVDHHREVILVDTDEDLLRILKTSFESYGLIVKTFVDAESTLRDLLERKASQLPALIIAERKLPDMDGLEMLNRLKARFTDPIPIFFLTVFSSDKDVSEGLKQGALEYVGKPFNLSILIQKALKVVFQDEEHA